MERTPPSRSGSRGNTLRVGWLVFGVGLVAATLLVASLVALYLPPEGESSSVEFAVNPGMTLSEVARSLSDHGLIRNRWLFQVAGRLYGAETRVKSGQYQLSRAQSSVEILRVLLEGRVALERITIPEGLTIEQTADVIAEQAGIPADRFLAYVESLDASGLVGLPVDGMEGFLFPNTYFVSEDATPRELVRVMVEAFHEAVGDSFPERAGAVGLTPSEVVALASVIEKEARVPEERARISAVFHNRLKRGWRLEADPTVRYALNRWEGSLSYRDLEVESPYNTYRVFGLPPGPIASPGRAAIEAALSPEPGSRDLYFVARGDGTHEFSRTLEAHRRAIAAIKRAKRKSS